MPPPFNRSVFVNCPFDDDYAPILQAVAFAVTRLGFHPRLAPENADNGANRLDRIAELIEQSRFGIHDLSRCRSTARKQYARMNMPFELGMDHAARRFGPGALAGEVILVLEDARYDYQKALSDIAGWDIEAHGGDYRKAVRHVRNWLVRQQAPDAVGATRILNDYADFQERHWIRELGRGASEDDVRAYPTVHVVEAMQEWVDAGRPA
jgi:hypothetical protein